VIDCSEKENGDFHEKYNITNRCYVVL